MLKLGIIGQPLTHSLSPILHAELMMALDLAGEYRKYELPSEQLAALLEAFPRMGGRGLNVTIPHKVAVMPLMQSLSPEAELAGAVNTIVFEPNPDRPDEICRIGHNTDMAGFIRGFPPDLRERLPQSRLLVLGAGGSARAVIAALIQAGVQSLAISARNPEKAALLLEEAERMRIMAMKTRAMKTRAGSTPQLSVLAPEVPLSLSAYHGVINTTPLGMWPETENSPLTAAQLEALPSDALIYDLIYRPAKTRLLQDAERIGLRTINGLDMLLFQGVCAFERWTGIEVPTEVIGKVRIRLSEALLPKISK